MTKGEETKRMILSAGLDMASELGLESVTIGALAKETGMSKSGLFSHFQSKENLQIAILQYAGDIFANTVVSPALKKNRGIPRIEALIDNWATWVEELKGGCIFAKASSDYSDRPGLVRDFLMRQQQTWHNSLHRIAQSAIDADDFAEDIDCDQFAFELYSLLLGFHLYHRLLQTPDSKARQTTALSDLLDKYRKG